MSIEQLEITNFRNLESIRLTPSPTINAIIGNNGSGKTSLLEAIHFLGTAKSFRTPHSKQAIQFEKNNFIVFGKITAGTGASVPVGLSRDKDSISIKISNRPVSSASTLAGLLPVQLINPDVHKMLEEGPRYRRRFMEWGLFHVKPSYFQVWQECRHILKQRNAALKQNLSKREIEHWDAQLCEKSQVITQMRKEYLEQLQPCIDRLLARSDLLPKVEMRLSQGWAKNRALEDVLKENLVSDRSRGFTQYGPHRLDLVITSHGVRAKEVVSRGQQKIITAIMKLAQLELLVQLEGSGIGVLLVDDLPAELDQQFRQLLIDMIAEQNSQVFITATDADLLFHVEHIPNRPVKMFHVEHGVVREMS